MRTAVLLIEDDPATVEDVRPVLVQEGYQVDHVLPGLPAIRRMLVDEPDLVILGINKSNGRWKFCRQLLTFLERPLLLLLSDADEVDRAKGLELGADDCMVKPVSMVELVARVRALLRRRSSDVSRRQQSYFVDGDLVVDLTRREVRLDDQPVALTRIEWRILSCLVRHLEEVASHEELRLEVWGSSRRGSQSSVKQYIHYLRQKLEPDPAYPQRIVTWRGEGYMLRRLVHDA